MSKIRRRFTKEQKLEIVKESMEPDVRIEALAQQYQVHANSIYKWRSEYIHQTDRAFPGKGKENLSGEEQEIKRLKKQLREAELEKEILKKALGIFSSPNKKGLHL